MNKIIIAHRGNINGPNPYVENRPSYLKKAIDLGYDVEADVWYMPDGKLYLGHDKPQYETTESFLHTGRMWCHAKNIAALEFLLEKNTHCFWHENDQYVATSYGYVWAYPGKIGTHKTITVMPELVDDYDLTPYIGICTDYASKYNEIFNSDELSSS